MDIPSPTREGARDAGAASIPGRIGLRAWAIFAVSFGLLLSDYMSRQVLSAVFPQLKADWGLSDAQLGVLGGGVALMVGLLTVPLSLLADRIGRVRSVVAMALAWSLATLGCALAGNFQQMLAARLMVGLGEAAYGSVAMAVVFAAFPASVRATITGAFMAGGVLGSFAGMALGGVLAAHFGWRWAFVGMTLVGLAFALLYPLAVREPATRPAPAARGDRLALVADPVVLLAYAGSGMQLFVVGAMTSWIASYLHRIYGLSTRAAALWGASALLLGGVGMVACGAIADRLSRDRPARRSVIAAAFGLGTFLLLEMGFCLPPGPTALVALGAGMVLMAGASGPAGAIVAQRTPPALHGSALAILTLANNLLGLAPGPIVAGVLADQLGLGAAMQIIPVAALLSAGASWIATRLRPAPP